MNRSTLSNSKKNTSSIIYDLGEDEFVPLEEKK